MAHVLVQHDALDQCGVLQPPAHLAVQLQQGGGAGRDNVACARTCALAARPSTKRGAAHVNQASASRYIAVKRAAQLYSAQHTLIKSRFTSCRSRSATASTACTHISASSRLCRPTLQGQGGGRQGTALRCRASGLRVSAVPASVPHIHERAVWPCASQPAHPQQPAHPAISSTIAWLLTS